MLHIHASNRMIGGRAVMIIESIKYHQQSQLQSDKIWTTVCMESIKRYVFFFRT